MTPAPRNAWAALAASTPIRTVTIALGLAWALAFIVIGLLFRLQMYGDGAAFSYAVALGESWAVHWHNIIGRVSVYLFCLLPAEALAQLYQDAGAAVTLYGFLFFGAQAAGLAATFACDASERRPFFTVACASTACICPLVFGFPTEMWFAHAAFWPALALGHCARRGPAGFASLLAGVLILVFTHEGALVLTLAIVATTLLHGLNSATFLRACAAFAIALTAWLVAQALQPPDAYFAPVFAHARLHFFDPHIFLSGAFAQLALVLAAYILLVALLRRFGDAFAAVAACGLVLAGLAVYWFGPAPALHAENRYYLRSALVILTPAFAILAAALALPDNRIAYLAPVAARLRNVVSSRLASSAAVALLLVTLVHAVEATRFLIAWTDYTAEVRRLSSAGSAPTGGAMFVSSTRIGSALQALAWSSTTPFLSVLVAPNFNPARLVIDPTANYFWLTCTQSRRDEAAGMGTIPKTALSLIRAYSCRHR